MSHADLKHRLACEMFVILFDGGEEIAHVLHPDTLYAWLEESGVMWMPRQQEWVAVDGGPQETGQPYGWLDAWLETRNRRWWAEQLQDIQGLDAEVENRHEGEARPRRGSGNR